MSFSFKLKVSNVYEDLAYFETDSYIFTKEELIRVAPSIVKDRISSGEKCFWVETKYGTRFVFSEQKEKWYVEVGVFGFVKGFGTHLNVTEDLNTLANKLIGMSSSVVNQTTTKQNSFSAGAHIVSLGHPERFKEIYTLLKSNN